MTSLSQFRCDEILKVADTLDAVMAGGRVSRSEFNVAVTEWSIAVKEVNAALADVEKLLASGLRDEAVSTHHPDLVKVARRLALRQRSQWTRVHGRMLEQGLPVPPDVDVAAAEQMKVAMAEAERLRPLLDKLRHLALTNLSLEERLNVLWQLRDLDSAVPVWLTQVDEHEEALLDDFCRRIAVARRAGDFGSLAAVERHLGDFRWSARIPATLKDDVAGASTVVRFTELRSEAFALAAELARIMPNVSSARDSRLSAAIAVREQLESVIDESTIREAKLALTPGMLALARQASDDRGCLGVRDGIRTELEQLQIFEAEHRTRTGFAEACRTLDYLVDHPPTSSGEVAWLADLQRAELEARHECQQLDDLLVPSLLAERVRRAAASIDSRQALRRRFALLVAASIVFAFLGMTAIVGWFIWKRGEQTQLDDRLKSALIQAQAGGFHARPEWLAGLADAGDSRVAATIARIDAAIASENTRAARFEESLTRAVEAVDELAVDVERRSTGGSLTSLDPWPAAFGRAVADLGDARRSGGRASRRSVWEGAAGSSPVTNVAPGASEESSLQLLPETGERQEDEEARFARVEVRCTRLDQEMERLADAVVQGEIRGIQQAIMEQEPAGLAEIRQRLRQFRDLAVATKSPSGGLPGRRTTRTSEASQAAISIVEQRLESMSRTKPPENSRPSPQDDR